MSAPTTPGGQAKRYAQIEWNVIEDALVGIMAFE